jgi:hypothetical protein
MRDLLRPLEVTIANETEDVGITSFGHCSCERLGLIRLIISFEEKT